MTRIVDRIDCSRIRSRPRGKLSFIFVLLLLGSAASASEGDDSYICDQIAEVAAARSGVPVSVLKAISLTETGRKSGGDFRPWPWTVNMEGKGVWFETEDQARAFVFKNFKRGARSFDIGCFQINYKWHHQNFSSLEEMFDPLANGIYAAKFLAELYAEKGNWEDAAGAYHSRTPENADRYKRRFAALRAKFSHQDQTPVRIADATRPPPLPQDDSRTMAPVPRVNNFPLLQTGQGQRGMGSLVPVGKSHTTPLFSLING